MKELCIFFGILITTGACKTPIDDSYINKTCDNLQGVKIDTSINSLSYVTSLSDQYLGMKPLIIPSDTFILRIRHETDSSVKLLEFKDYNNQYSIVVYQIPIDQESEQIVFNKSKDNITNYETRYDQISKGNKFIQQLKKNNLLILPSFRDIPGYPIYEHTTPTYIFEYSRFNCYKVFWYRNPYANRNRFKEAESVANFLDFLKKEFNF